MESAVLVKDLTRRFRSKVALDNVSLTVEPGCVFGLVGENGAGKTTLIKHLMGLLNAQSGSVRVFGADPVNDPAGALSRIGYLSEDRDIPGWMRVDELMRYTQGFYPKWDDGFADELCKTFELDLTQKIKTLSLGQTAKAALIAALAHRPDLLVLDEPSSGLDALVRQHILGAIIRTVADEGRTVLFSSHLLDEVEAVSDYVAIINQGKIVICDRLDAIRSSHCRLALAFDEAQARPPALPGALSCVGNGKEWVVIGDGEADALKTHAASLNATVVHEETPSLEEIFVARVGLGRASKAEARKE